MIKENTQCLTEYCVNSAFIRTVVLYQYLPIVGPGVSLEVGPGFGFITLLRLICQKNISYFLDWLTRNPHQMIKCPDFTYGEYGTVPFVIVTTKNN